jgi:hypothetical protein
VPWLLYRKQWLSAVLVLVVPFLLGHFMRPELFGTLMSVIYALWGKSMVVKKAARDVRAAVAAESNPQYLRERIEREGGVSVPAAIVGGVIEGILVALVVMAGILVAAHHGLPAAPVRSPVNAPVGAPVSAPVAVENYVVQSAPPAAI